MGETMNTSVESGTADVRSAVVGALKHNWGWFVGVGIAFICIGIAAVALPFASSVAVELLIGSAIAVAGLFSLVHAVKSRGAGGLLTNFLISLLMLAVGTLLLAFPLEGILTLTVLLAAFFMVSGVFRIIGSLQMRDVPTWGWGLASGIIALILGTIIWAELPGDSRWVLGFIVGVDLIFSGLTLLITGRAIKHLK
jgi:uncharacterized membrane protein HdeD (DUF308 family)